MGLSALKGFSTITSFLMQTAKFDLMQTVKSNASFLVCHIQCLPYAKQSKDALI